MAEAYHQWLANMSPLERLWWTFYDPSVLSCSGNYIGFPFGKVLIFSIILIVIVGYMIRKFSIVAKTEEKKQHEH